MRVPATLPIFLSACLLATMSTAAVDLPVPAVPAAPAPQDQGIAILTFEEGKEAAGLAALARLGAESHVYPLLGMAAVATGPPEGAGGGYAFGAPVTFARLAALPGVEAVWPNEHMYPMLDQSAPYIGAPIVWQQYDHRGDGITIQVVDTGIDGTHPDVRLGQNLIQNVLPTRSPSGLLLANVESVPNSDSDGHGTHVAGIVAGTAQGAAGADSNQGRYRGVAPAASLIGFAAGLPAGTEADPRFETVTVLEAFEYALQNKDRYNIRVVTNSWGTDGAFNADAPVSRASRELYRAGLVVFFAAGNDGGSGPGSLNKYCGAPWVLCVGAGDYVNNRAPFSSVGTDPADSGKPYDHPDLLAPGVGITSARPVGVSPGSPIDAVTGLVGQASGNGGALYVQKSGTSMATPHAAGAAALVLGANPDLSPDQVYDVLVASATRLPNRPVWEVGAGYLNVLDAVRTAKTLPGELDAFLGGNMKYASGDLAIDSVSHGLGVAGPSQLRGVEELSAVGAQLTGTVQGWTFLGGTLLLTLAAFGVRRR